MRDGGRAPAWFSSSWKADELMLGRRHLTWVSRVLLGAVAIAAALGALALWSASSNDHTAPGVLPVTTSQAPAEVATSAGPKLVRSLKTGPGPAGQLIIPSLDVTAPMTWTAITNGEFDVPADVSSVGVWSGGARPGDRAGAVLAVGHVSDNTDRPGALHDLPTIQTGARVEILDPDGRTWTYRVTAIDEYGQNNLPRDLTSSEAPVLRLVSCTRRVVTDGGRAFHYTHNVVITATPQGAPS